ncbi:MAG TPA: NAD(P)H-dependent glycerol-3-phosphate dehydrogenase, partial [Planctomycetota bacterium]|nr:NAD(P)H-dependent glycerol-3-phosphate dehydrogenase [Planctomycetota bacterium]
RGHDVTLWGRDPDYVDATRHRRENVRYLKGVTLPKALRLTADAEDALQGAQVVVNAVPTQFVRGTFEPLAPLVPARVPVLSLSKGIEVRTLLRPSQVLGELLPKRPIAVLSGPSHAEEVARRSPASVVVAARSHPLARKFQSALSTERFRVYTNLDPAGVELAGALKNVVAIAAGICDGLGFGDNAKAALVTRGLVEISRLAAKLGARRSTFAGLAGMGDLVTTAFSRHGRNRAVGEKLGQGKTLGEILDKMNMVAEGVETTRSALALARRHRVDMPIVREVHEILFEEKNPLDALTSLMTRSTKTEI